MRSSDLKYWIWLSLIPKLGCAKRIQLIEYFGNPKVIWNMTGKELKGISFINCSIIEHLLDLKLREAADIHLENIRKHCIKAITYNDDAYPNYLKNIYDPPLVLYMKGKHLECHKAVAVVGSRRASFYGLEIAEALACELSKCSIAVVSGMARGVDTCAHRGALKAGGNTIAVLGCGLDIAYPSENKSLMEEIALQGAVVSEYLPGVEPFPYNFPARNRIISGMSLGVVVIEAGEKSGSLITADFALEQGREVFAVPGNVTSFNSKGANKLIKDGAKMVTCIEDILEELNIIIDKNKNAKKEYKKITDKEKYKGLEPEEIQLVKCLEGGEMQIDSLTLMSGLEIQTVNSLLVMLELKGIIEQFPGKVYKLRSVI